MTLLACSVWAEMVSISQIVTSSGAGPSKATIVLSAILFFAIVLLVIMLPIAFFRVKVQDAREQAQFHQVERNVARSLALQQEMTETRPRVLPDHDGSAVMCTTTDRTRAGAATPDESVAAEQASTRPLASKKSATPWTIRLVRTIPKSVQQLFGLDKRLARAEIVAIQREIRTSRANKSEMARVVQETRTAGRSSSLLGVC